MKNNRLKIPKSLVQIVENIFLFKLLTWEDLLKSSIHYFFNFISIVVTKSRSSGIPDQIHLAAIGFLIIKEHFSGTLCTL